MLHILYREWLPAQTTDLGRPVGLIGSTDAREHTVSIFLTEPRVIEIRRRLEPVTRDPFIDGLEPLPEETAPAAVASPPLADAPIHARAAA